VRLASSFIAFLLMSLLASSLVSLLVNSTCCRPLQHLGHWHQFRLRDPSAHTFEAFKLMMMMLFPKQVSSFPKQGFLVTRLTVGFF
jgi:hypothetical protein